MPADDAAAAFLSLGVSFLVFPLLEVALLLEDDDLDDFFLLPLDLALS